MRRKQILTAIAFVAVLALVSLLLRQTENGDFGNARDVYALTDTVKLSGIEGDDDLLRPLRMHPNSSLEAPRFDFAAGDTDIALTALHYKDGMPVIRGGEALPLYGTIDRWDGEDWKRYGTVRYELAGRDDVRQVCPVIRAGEELSINIHLPTHDPGKYRFTYYFRECLDAERLTTGETLCSVSHTFTVEPEHPTGEDFDLLGVELIDLTDSGDPELPAHRMRLMLRTYTRSVVRGDILCKFGTIRLETLEDGKWVPHDAALNIPAGEPEMQTYTSGTAGYLNKVTPYIEIPEASPSRKYRLTLEFSSNSFEYPNPFRVLTLNLDFSKED